MTRARRHTLTRRLVAAAATLTAGALLAATPATAQAASKPAAPATPAAAPAPVVSAQGYNYNPAGRRDPFVSLLTRGTDARSGVAARPDGLAGLNVDELALRGIVQSRGRYVAMVQAPDGKNYTVKAGDKLFDGVVKAVTGTAVIFEQKVNDPLSFVTQREVRKPLRPTEEGK